MPRMARKKEPLSSIHPYHITARFINRESFGLCLDTLWHIMMDYLCYLHMAYEIKIHNFVLMPNHFHLIARNPKQNLSDAMRYFMRETSRHIAIASGRINQVYGARFHRSAIRGERYFQHAYKYVYRNPVKAGLVERCEDYPFSTLGGKLGQCRLIIPVENDFLLFGGNVEQAISWLNRAPASSDEEAVRKALRRTVFELPKDRAKRQPHNLETGLF